MLGSALTGIVWLNVPAAYEWNEIYRKKYQFKQ